MSHIGRKFLIVGLGNPGNRYEKTRHNIGKKVVQYFAKQYDASFQEKTKLFGAMAKVPLEENLVHLFFPLTYMNESGLSVSRVLTHLSVELSSMLVVYDDADLPFNEMILKQSGGTGGHRGLKSIQDVVASDAFPRLRMGIGREEGKELADYVLSPFSSQEKAQMPALYQKAFEALLLWIQKGITQAMNVANVRKTKRKEQQE